MINKNKPYRIRYTSPPFKSTHKELMKHIQNVNSMCVVANNVLGGYELKIKLFGIKNKQLVSDNIEMMSVIKNLNIKIEELEAEKYPPMDKIKDLPEVKEEDLPFLMSGE